MQALQALLYEFDRSYGMLTHSDRNISLTYGEILLEAGSQSNCYSSQNVVIQIFQKLHNESRVMYYSILSTMGQYDR